MNFISLNRDIRVSIISSSSFPSILRTDLMHEKLPVGLITAQLVRALHQYHRGQGSNFFRLSFATAQVASLTAMIFVTIIFSTYNPCTVNASKGKTWLRLQIDVYRFP